MRKKIPKSQKIPIFLKIPELQKSWINEKKNPDPGDKKSQDKKPKKPEFSEFTVA